MKKRSKTERLRSTPPRQSWRERLHQSRVPLVVCGLALAIYLRSLFFGFIRVGLPQNSSLAFVESVWTALERALLSSVVLHLDVARAHGRRPLALGLASLECSVACRRHISGVPAVPEADGE